MVYNRKRRGEASVRVVGRNNITFCHMVTIPLGRALALFFPRVEDARCARGGWHPETRSAYRAGGPGRSRVSSGGWRSKCPWAVGEAGVLRRWAASVLQRREAGVLGRRRGGSHGCLCRCANVRSFCAVNGLVVAR